MMRLPFFSVMLTRGASKAKERRARQAKDKAIMKCLFIALICHQRRYSALVCRVYLSLTILSVAAKSPYLFPSLQGFLQTVYFIHLRTIQPINRKQLSQGIHLRFALKACFDDDFRSNGSTRKSFFPTRSSGNSHRCLQSPLFIHIWCEWLST
jgi:hypothetical protein